ncbi:glycoside hydrolase family 92 protein [Aulographum hederae CBS 113979]|uniref:Glycoside hydrolase family 92 protein n=1 Tax=Aulographum hederae CBS 113979 TaxID=1176131 RepID=A0A6G1H7L8_9PEZI|nr:glycoside hydrolase family 92 protein [Aulographum hederae CBS 113979]
MSHLAGQYRASVLSTLCFFLSVSAPALAQKAQNPPGFDPLSFVNPLIGSNNGGNVFAGASIPYGMAKAVADVSGQNTGGFSTDGSNITGFSHTHDSGTGGNPSLGNFPLFPQYCPGDDINNCKYPKLERAVNARNDSIVARPGYFALELENGIRAEMTTSEHTALYHFTFPPSPENGTALHPQIVLDLTDIGDTRQNASIGIDPSGRMKGNGTFLPSFGAGSFMLHFCADFAGGELFDSGLFVNERAGNEPKEIFVTRGFNLFYLQAGGFVRFVRPANGTISARVGVSFISADQACSNAEREIPGPVYDFNGTRREAEDAWRRKLSPIAAEAGGVDESMQRSFWSGIYRNMLSPQDYTGENPLWQSDEPYFDSFYCIWDSFRAQHPLLTIIDPATQSRMVRSLLDTYKHEGWLPDCRMSLSKGWTQGGSNTDVVLVDAYVKNLTGINWDMAYAAILNDAENEPQEWSYEGRGGLVSWKTLNYIPYLDYDYLGFGTNSRSISRTLEYAYNDFCLSTLARGLDKDDATVAKYLARSSNWQNLWKFDQRSDINGTDTGFLGFLQPKFLNGTWGYQDPIACGALTNSFCSLTSNPSETFESTVWEYIFYVPHDIATLISLVGGPAPFIKRLDFFHDYPGLADISNEPVFLTVFLYHYAGRPALSALRAHSYIPAYFNDTNSGLPGNDDSGAMGAFQAFAMMGLFPVPGQNVYLITPPFFEAVGFGGAEGNGSATVRVVEGFDVMYKNLYIQSAKLNGEVYTRNWVGHEFFTHGWTLELVLGDTESEWGTREEDLPPSVKTGGFGNL